MKSKTFLSAISISNFRAFKQLDANKFGQVNLITGKNNSGKTALLEALYLNLGPTNPTLWININARRGIERVSPRQSTSDYLYFQRDVTDPISFYVNTRTHGNHKLIIRVIKPPLSKISTEQELENLFNNKSVVIGESENSLEVEIIYQREGENPEVSKAIILPNKIEFEGERRSVFPNSIYISTSGMPNLSEEAKRYDEINRANQLEIFDKSLKIIEPNLIRTSLGIENDITMVHADVGYGLVPITLLGSGSKRLTSILLALANSKDGIVLIDELENGFHYSILEKIWLSIVDFVESNGTQVFISTHSQECIQAALNAIENRPRLDFRLHRLDRKTDRTEVYTFEREQLKASLDTGWEVR
jgi:AAA15 family ATPase/GTPase